MIVAAIIGLQVLGPFIPIRVLYNPSASMPTGFYVCLRTSDAGDGLARGDIVAFAPPESVYDLNREWVPPRRVLWIKYVAGLPGDYVCNAENTVEHTDTAGRALPISDFCGKLSKNQFWLRSDQPHAYDSRYFGPVTRSQIKYKALWVIHAG